MAGRRSSTLIPAIPRDTLGNTLLALVVLVAWTASAVPAARGATFTVDGDGDQPDLVIGDGICATAMGTCTLRAAIREANATPGPDEIRFDLAGSTVIAPLSALPGLADPVVLDGTTQPGWAPGAPLVTLDGSGAGTAVGLRLQAGSSGSTVRGLVLRNHDGSGLSIASDDSLVEGCWIVDNAVEGIAVTGSGNRIGGPSVEARNVVSGNGSDGIQVFGTGGGNVIQGSFIGTDAAGTAPWPNVQNGILVLNANNRIGGTATGAGNVISGNGNAGVQIREPSATANVVEGNLIGLDATGTAPLGNAIHGVMISGAPGNRVGGVELGARNVLSANGSIGVFVVGTAATGNAIEGNFVGTDRDGDGSGATAPGTPGPFGNGGGVQINAPGNRVGGSDPRAGNVIVASGFYGVSLNGFGETLVEGNRIGAGVGGLSAAGNGDDGVQMVNGTSGNTLRDNQIAYNLDHGIVLGSGTGNRFLSGSIHDNGGLGIELWVDGPTPNDPGDADTGANGLQNHPEITAVRASGADATLDSAPNAAFTVQFFASDVCDPSGFGEGKTFLGETSVATDGAGLASFSVSFSPAAATGQQITATATDGAGNTSEFSPCALVEGLEVAIDIKPGSFPNSINIGSSGVVPVAILSAPGFDATTVDPSTVTLASAPVKLRGRGTPQASEQDVNGDGLDDLVVQVETEALDLESEDTDAVLEGFTFGGTEIRGVDSVRVVP